MKDASPRSRILPDGFPHPNRASGVSVFCAAIDCSRTTLFRFVRLGMVPPPIQIGGRISWPETQMAEVVRNGTRKPADAALA